MRFLFVLFLLVLPTACNQADILGVGAACKADSDCVQEEKQTCLQQFKGGYCGIENCTSNADCPANSACVSHTDGKNYCFRTCTDKSQCNVNRTADAESNCSANVNFADGSKGPKACVPPAG